MFVEDVGTLGWRGGPLEEDVKLRGDVGLGRMSFCKEIWVGSMTGWARCQVWEDVVFDFR